jgi:hypothetical protein
MQISGIGFVFVVLWSVEAAVLMQTRNLFSNVVWRLTDDATRFSLVLLMAASCLFAAVLTAVLLVVYRNAESQFKGLRAVFISTVIVGNAFALVGSGAQMYPFLIQVTSSSSTAREFPDSTLLPILQDGYVPSSRSWMPWGSAMAGAGFLVGALTLVLWNILSLRDYSEYEKIRDEVEVRYTMLGATPSVLLRGGNTTVRARRVGLLFLLTSLSSIVVCGILFKANVEFSDPQKRADIAIQVGASALGLLGFSLFSWSFYRVALLWLHISLSIVQGIATIGIMSFWVLWRLKFAGDLQNIPGFEIAVYIFATISSVLYFVSAIFAASFVRWATPNLAGDVNVNIQNRMSRIYEQD